MKTPLARGFCISRVADGLFLLGLFLGLFLALGRALGFALVLAFLEKAGELLLEPRQARTAVKQLLLAAGPGRVRLRVDVEIHDIALLAPGRAGDEFGAVGHHNLDAVIVRMNLGFHRPVPGRCTRAQLHWIWRLYTAGG